MSIAEKALQEWIKTQSLPVSDVEEHGFINGYNWALKDNKPVAWLMVNRDDGNKFIQIGKPTRDDKVGHEPYPLYTHPAKTLTDYEIKGVLGLDECWVGEDCSIPDMIAFARAILRKAQEKC